MVDAAAKHKRVTQMGNLIHAGENYRRVVEIVRSGVLGHDHQDARLDGRPTGRGSAARPTRPRRRASTTTSGSARRPKRPFNPNRFTLQLALLLGLRRRHPLRLLLPHRRPRPLGDGRRRPRDDHRHRRPLRPRRQRRDARHARGRLPLPQGRAGLRPWSGARPTAPTASRARTSASCSRGPTPRSSPTTAASRSSPRRASTIELPPEDAPALRRPPPRVARRDQVARTDVVPLRVRPSALNRRPPRQHRPLDRREAPLGRQAEKVTNHPEANQHLWRDRVPGPLVAPEGLILPMIELLAIPAWQTPADDARRLGRPARITRLVRPWSSSASRPRGPGSTSSRCGVHGYAVLAGSHVEAINFELPDPDPARPGAASSKRPPRRSAGRSTPTTGETTRTTIET